MRKKTKGYANESTGDIQKVDLGIALYHFEVGAKEQGLKGSILQKNPGISTAENVEYIATYQWRTKMDTKFSSAIHSLIMISESETPVNSEQIANSVGTNASYIRKLTTRLSKAGIIEGRKGISGFRLLKPAREISLLEIYKSIMEVKQVHIFDIHQIPNDEYIVGRSIKPTLEGMFRRWKNKWKRSLPV